MNALACYLVAVLHAEDHARPDAAPPPVHLFVLPASAVEAAAPSVDGRLAAAATLAFQLATTDPMWLAEPWAGLASGYRSQGLRPFRHGDAMVVLPPGGPRHALRYASSWWKPMAALGDGGPGC